MRRSEGFTLIEMAVVIAIAGVLLTLGVSVAMSQLQNAQRAGSKTALDGAKDALLGYFAGNHRFPCPDDDRDGLEDFNGPISNGRCANALGTIPYSTMGIPRAQVMDGYGNFLSYVLSADRNPPLPVNPANPWIWANQLTTYTTPTLPQVTSCSRDGSTPDVGPRGELVVETAPGTEVTIPGNNGDGRIRAVLVLISHGANALGAWGPTGVRNTLPPAASPERANTQAVNTPPPVNGSTPNIYHAYAYSDVAATPFDDQLVYVTEGNRSPLLPPPAPPPTDTPTGTLYNFMVGSLHRPDICQ
ncbi:type II secretion system protein [Chitinimonas arctica]|nr:type II secretion system protein [Chitinimonas arctica]